MDKLKYFVFLLLLLVCQSSWAATSKGTLLYIPLDNRPVCLDYTVATMEAAGWKVKTPPLEYIACREHVGQPEKLFAWIDKESRTSLGMVISADTLIYGGLVASRTHEIPIEVLNQRAQALSQLKERYRDQLVYVFASVMRSPKSSGAPVEPTYYSQWGPMLFKLGELEDKLASGDIGRREKRQLQVLHKKIPSPVLKDMYARRAANLQVTEHILECVKNKNFDYVLIGKDDTAPYSRSHYEARILEKKLENLPKEKIRFLTGVDQLGLILLTRCANRLQYRVPLVKVFYAPGSGGNTLPTYEDQLLDVTVEEQILAAGGVPVNRERRADLFLGVNTPRDGVTMEGSDSSNDGVVTEELEAFTQDIKDYLHDHKAVSVADVKYGNGGDKGLVKQLFAKNLAWQLASYGGWNTASNTLGFALAQGILEPNMTTEAKDELLIIRYLDDWAYQSQVRLRVYQTLIWPQSWNNTILKPGQKAMAERAITRSMRQVAMPLFGKKVKNYKFTLPWSRMFEINIERK